MSDLLFLKHHTMHTCSYVSWGDWQRNKELIILAVIRRLKCSEDESVQQCFYLFCLYLFLIVNSMSCRQVIKGEAGCSIPA